MKVVIFTSMILIIQYGCFVNGKIKFKVTQNPKFPSSLRESFIFKLFPENNVKTLSDHLFDTLVLIINDENGEILEKSFFDYGFKDSIDQEFIGKYMQISKMEKGVNNQYIYINITFTRIANNKTLSIKQILSKNQIERSQNIRNIQLTDKIYEETINLLIPSKLDLSIQTIDGRKGEFIINEKGIAICRAYDGVPKHRPEWDNWDQFDSIENNYFPDTNTRKLTLIANIQYHDKKLICRAGRTMESINIFVLHHPSHINIEPNIDSTINNDSKIICSSLDGYPIPDINWKFIQGPINASQYYNISNDGKILYMTSSAVIGSDWIFNCSASNILPNSNFILNRTISFTIVPMLVYQPNEHLNTIIIVSLVGGILILVAIVTVTLLCLNTIKNNKSSPRLQEDPPEYSPLEKEKAQPPPPRLNTDYFEGSEEYML